MKVIKNELSEIPLIESNVDSDKELAFIPKYPLPKRGSLYLSGAPGSGKSSLWYALLLSKPTKKNKTNKKYYNKYFDHIEVISNSLSTVPLDKFKLPEEQTHGKYSDELLLNIIEKIKLGVNLNALVVLDDCIRDLTKSKVLCSLLQNRRHLTQNPAEKGCANLSIWITGQKFNLLPLVLRTSISHCAIWKSTNSQEQKAIKSELMSDLDNDTADQVLNLCWKRNYGFIFINVNAQRGDRYFSNFDKIEM